MSNFFENFEAAYDKDVSIWPDLSLVNPMKDLVNACETISQTVEANHVKTTLVYECNLTSSLVLSVV